MSLSLWRKTNQQLFNKEMEETAEMHVGVHKPKMTKDNFTTWQRNGGKDKKNGEEDCAFFLFLFFFWKAAGLKEEE